MSYTDAYQHINQYVRVPWQSEWDTAVNNKLQVTKPLIGEQPSAYRSVENLRNDLSLGTIYTKLDTNEHSDPNHNCEISLNILTKCKNKHMPKKIKEIQ